MSRPCTWGVAYRLTRYGMADSTCRVYRHGGATLNIPEIYEFSGIMIPFSGPIPKKFLPRPSATIELTTDASADVHS